MSAAVTGCAAPVEPAAPPAEAAVADQAVVIEAPELAVEVGDVGEVAGPQPALVAAGLLTVKGRAPKTGYSRDQFGAAWADIDQNGCDQRNDVLARDLTGVTFKAGTCLVLAGQLSDPYGPTDIAFARGETTSSAVQIDHVVALLDAWQKGAQQWDPAARERFANDQENLLAVDGPLNSQKGAGDAATWLPPNKAFRCEYVARQVGVKGVYGLWVTQAEQDAMVRVLSQCPSTQVPAGLEAPIGSPVAPTSAPDATPEPALEPGSAEMPFASCAAARAAGAAPVYRGDPGYAPHLDGDDDGVGCE